jgi:A/G-specific adenine glycosylase
MACVRHSERIDAFVRTLHAWYRLHRRELPWRDLWDIPESDRAYRVWISEVMLQQTQVSRVIGSYKKFIQKFPTVQKLGAATNAEILIAWRGMGYNSRALRLRDGAKEIARRAMVRRARHDNNIVTLSLTKGDVVFPCAMEDLMAIPGIGAYTAGAIRTFAFDLPTVAMDVNIRRIIHRTFVGPENADGTWTTDDAKLTKILSDVIDAWVAAGHRGSDLFSALMDYGSLVQTKNSPKWDVCILTEQGIMKATPKNWKPVARGSAKEKLKKEPGRYVGRTYVPNRIFRGRIVEALRDHPKGLKIGEIAKWISPDHGQEPKGWLEGLIKKLIQDGMLKKRGQKYVLAE